MIDNKIEKIAAPTDLDMSELENVSGGSLIDPTKLVAGKTVAIGAIGILLNPKLGSIIGGVARRC